MDGFAELDGMILCLEALAQVPARTAGILVFALEKQIQAEFDTGVDAYGRPWAPLALSTIAKGRFAPPLTDIGDMRNSVNVVALPGAGVAIDINLPADFHQGGWNGRRGSGPARPILPDEGVLPQSWQEVIDKHANLEFRRAMKQ